MCVMFLFVMVSIGWSWIDERLGIWDSGHQGLWASGTLGIWVSGHLGVRASGHLKIWAPKLLSAHQSRTTLYGFDGGKLVDLREYLVEGGLVLGDENEFRKMVENINFDPITKKNETDSDMVGDTIKTLPKTFIQNNLILNHLKSTDLTLSQLLNNLSTTTDPKEQFMLRKYIRLVYPEHKLNLAKIDFDKSFCHRHDKTELLDETLVRENIKKYELLGDVQEVEMNECYLRLCEGMRV